VRGAAGARTRPWWSPPRLGERRFSPLSGAADRRRRLRPDGRRLAFVRIRGGRADIYLVDADGSGLRRLAHAMAFAPMPGGPRPRLARKPYTVAGRAPDRLRGQPRLQLRHLRPERRWQRAPKSPAEREERQRSDVVARRTGDSPSEASVMPRRSWSGPSADHAASQKRSTSSGRRERASAADAQLEVRRGACLVGRWAQDPLRETASSRHVRHERRRKRPAEPHAERHSTLRHRRSADLVARRAEDPLRQQARRRPGSLSYLFLASATNRPPEGLRLCESRLS